MVSSFIAFCFSLLLWWAFSSWRLVLRLLCGYWWLSCWLLVSCFCPNSWHWSCGCIKNDKNGWHLYLHGKTWQFEDYDGRFSQHPRFVTLDGKVKTNFIPSLEPKKMKNTIAQIWQWIEIAFIIMWLMKLVLMIFQRSWNRCLKKKLLTIKYFCKRNWLLWKWCSMLRYKYLSCYVLYQAIGRLLL